MFLRMLTMLFTMVLLKFSFKVHYKLRHLFVKILLLYRNKIQIKEYFVKISTQF